VSVPALPCDCDWMIDGRLCACSWPARACLEALKDRGFTLVVSVAAEDTAAVHAACLALGLKWLRYRVPDMTAPELGDVRDFVAEVDAELGRGGRVAVHCLGGIGRTGTMIACYLVSVGWQPDEATAHVRRRRPGSIQTNDQEHAVYRYYAALRDPTGSAPPWGG
jgi:atypical dual specificity phosphatase